VWHAEWTRLVKTHCTVRTQYYPHTFGRTFSWHSWVPMRLNGTICPISHTKWHQAPGQGRYMNPPLSVRVTKKTPTNTMEGSRRRPLSAGERTTVVTLLEQGKSLAAIGTLLGRSRSTIAYAAKMARKAAAGPRFDKRGRPKAPTDRQRRCLKQVVGASRFTSVVALTETINLTRAQAGGGPNGGPVSTSTVRRALKAMGYASSVPAKRTLPVGYKHAEAPRLVY